MSFEGVVWRYVPANTTPFHVHYLIHAAGRWNRRGVYGCLYTALTPEGAVAELPPESADQQVTLERKLGTILLSHLIGNSAADLDACPGLADRVRQEGYLAIHAPSAAEPGTTILAIYPENRPDELAYGPDLLDRFALNHGPARVADDRANLLRPLA